MEVRPGYKQTEVGVIPEEWQTPKVGDVCGCIVPGRDKPRLFDGDIPWITTPDLENGKAVTASRLGLCISRAEAKSVGSKIVPPGSVLMSCAGELGIVAMTKNAIVVNQQLHVFIPTERIEAAFLLNALAYRKVQIEDYGTKTAVPYLNKNACNSIPIPLPPLPEQRAIAAALGDVDALLDGLDRLIAKKRDLKQAAMQQLLTGQTRIPGFYGEWEVKRLADVADVLKGSGLSKSRIAASGTCPCILYGELFTTYDRVISDVVSRTNSSDGIRSVLGDVLLPGSTTTTGADLATASALLIEDVALGGDIIIVRRKGQDYVPSFLARYLTHTRRHEIAELTQGITIHHLYGKDLRTLSLQLPSLPEQTTIAAVFSDMDAELAALEARRNKTRDLKQAMMQELLTGRTRLVPAGGAYA